MKSRILDISAVSSPYKEVMQRELEVLKMSENVLAIGLTGSVARRDLWIGSDLDLVIILKGDWPTKVVLTEQEISVDYVYISESHINDLYPDTVPVYDPQGIIRKTLEGLDEKLALNEIKERVRHDIELAGKSLEKANSVLNIEPYSALCFTHLAGVYLGSAIVLAVTKHSPGRRPVSKLEMVTKEVERPGLLNTYLSLYGMPYTVRKAGILLRELEEGFRQIWGYFRDKKVGPPYMIQQSEPEPYLRNRIRPIYEHDKRDLVRVVYSLFPYILLELLKSVGEEDLPNRIFYEPRKFAGLAAFWIERYRRVLKFIPRARVHLLVTSANELQQEIQAVLSSSEF